MIILQYLLNDLLLILIINIIINYFSNSGISLPELLGIMKKEITN